MVEEFGYESGMRGISLKDGLSGDSSCGSMHKFRRKRKEADTQVGVIKSDARLQTQSHRHSKG